MKKIDVFTAMAVLIVFGFGIISGMSCEEKIVRPITVVNQQDEIDSLRYELCVKGKLIAEYKRIWDCYRQWFDSAGIDYPCFGYPINMNDCDSL